MKLHHLALTDQLPLTCSRKGTCCFGNRVLLNPWELANLAQHKQMSLTNFRETYTEAGGIVLKFQGKVDHRGKTACNQYIENFGCSVHEGRPLACRLFPIARQIQNGKISYGYQGTIFPCLNGCPEVIDLPKLSVKDYLTDQQTSVFEQAQDAYLEIMQNLADIGMMLLLDTELVQVDAKNTLVAWKQISQETIDELSVNIGKDWLTAILEPPMAFSEPIAFSNAHQEHLQSLAQNQIDQIQDLVQLKETSLLFIRIALYLAHAIGADSNALCELWIQIAKENGAHD